MQNSIQIFENSEFGKVRVVIINEQPWWVLKDVCSVLGIKNHKMTAQRLDGDEVSLTDLTDLREDAENNDYQRKRSLRCYPTF